MPAKERSPGARIMWVIYLEMGVALAILILIVWFTRPRRRDPVLPPATAEPPAPEDKDRQK